MQAIMWMYWLSQTLITAVGLGVFDQLADRPRTAADVAASLHLHPQATERLLRALASAGFLQQHGPLYAATPEAKLAFVRGSPHYIGPMAKHHADLLWPLWTHLPTAVKEGRPVLREAFGGDQNPFDLITADRNRLIDFLGGMEAGAKGMGEALAMSHDFSRQSHILDVGGGTGAIALPLLRRYPHLAITLFDLPSVCAVMGPVLAQSGAGGRLQLHPGDFFKPESFPTTCDAAVLCRVLHDWSDDKAVAILRHIRAALRPGGTVLVLENLLDAPDPESRMFSALSDLTMLVLTDGGRERTAAEYERLLAMAGFHVLGTVRAGGPMAVTKGWKI